MDAGFARGVDGGERSGMFGERAPDEHHRAPAAPGASVRGECLSNLERREQVHGELA